MSGKSPTARTLEACRKRGWPAQVVEKWLPGRRRNPKTGQLEETAYGVRKDLFGFIDLVVLDDRPGVLGIQTCAGASLAARLDKAREQEHFEAWLAAGNRFQVWGWREVWVDTSAKTKRRLWEPRIIQAEPPGQPQTRIDWPGEQPGLF